jgi:hypothetical protein
MTSGKSLLFIALLLAIALGQQLCVRQYCTDQRQACLNDPNCQTVIGDAIEKCTLQSQGCMMFNTANNDAASSFVRCSYDNCLNI